MRFCRDELLGKNIVPLIFFEKDKMKEIRKVRLFALLIVAALFVQNVSATYCLPESRYENNAWRNSSICGRKEFNVRIDFTICDTRALQSANETELSEQFDIADQYFYSCQIFKRGNYIRDEIVCLGILDIGGQRIDEALLKSDTSCHSNSSGLGAPARQHRNTRGLWGRIHNAGPIY